jgi:hypothetical protein
MQGHRFFIRLAVIAAGVLTLMGGITLVAAPVAHAQTPVLNCLGTESDQLEPGMTNTRQPIEFINNDTLGSCIVPTQLNLTGGTARYVATFVQACTDLNFGPYQVRFHWNNGMQSLVNFSTSVAPIVNGEIQVASTGVVGSGFGAGDTAVETLILAQLDPTACSSPQGVTSAAGPLTLTFTAS